jgi:hypothetical protein
MSTVDTVAGWYPDPTGAPSLRWWDGRQWTPNTHAGAAAISTSTRSDSGWDPGAGFINGVQTSPQQQHAGGYSPPQNGQPVGALNHGVATKGRNHYSLITFGVGALYLVLAFVTHFVLVGFVPLAISLRAKRSGEPLAPLAMAAAIGVILFSLVTVLH